MNRENARTTLIAAIAHVAPNADPGVIDPGEDLMEELDLDSIDLVGVVAWIHENAGIDIPERDYDELYSLDSFVDYLAAKAEASS